MTRSQRSSLLSALAAGAAFLPGLVATNEIISLNFWANGGGVPKSTWEDYLTLEPTARAGVGEWQTSGWENYELPWSPSSPQTPDTLTGTEGSTVTFTLNDVRNGGPCIRRTPRSIPVDDPIPR